MTAPTIVRRTNRGQTLVIALIVLGVLLALGLVFLGIVSRNVQATAFNQRRTVASDLAEAGVRYAHRQLLDSLQGADWRPSTTPVTPAAVNTTRDPDILYIRPGTGYGLRGDADPQKDLGGPDGLGPYTRIDFENGRALVRVRYAPSDANIFSSAPSGPLRNPGRARMYTIIESVGRPGKVAFNDPTALSGTLAIQYQAFVDGTAFRTALSAMRRLDSQVSLSSKSIAFASIPLIQSLFYVSNLDKVNRPADFGSPTELNALFTNIDFADPTENHVDIVTGKLSVAPFTQITRPISLLMGDELTLFNFGNPPTPTITPVGLGGSIYSAAPLRFHGYVTTRMNGALGDLIATSEKIVGADGNAALSIERNFVDGTGMWQPPVTTVLQNTTDPSLNSDEVEFDTVGGLLRDGDRPSTLSDQETGVDRNGFQRGVGSIDPPSMQRIDPDTGQTRYRTMTRESGLIINGVNSGQFGHGRNIYVNNTADRQMRVDDEGRERVATAESQVDDWLKPNNGEAGSGWVGPFYVPRGAHVTLMLDGFLITRDSRGPEAQRTWLGEDGETPVDQFGTEVQTGTIRYRLGYDSDGRLKIANTFTPDPLVPGESIDINAASINFDQVGQPFGGVLFFEGNVRVRGTIATDVQVTLVSNATIYIEGSVVKGVTEFDGGRITGRPSRSTLMLMAKEYVTLNTTQFFGSGLGNAMEEANDVPSAVAFNPIRMRVGGTGLSFMVDFPLDPNSATPSDPATWRPFAIDYEEFNATDPGEPVAASMLFAHTMDDGPAPATFVSLFVNQPVDNASVGAKPIPRTDDPDWQYYFESSDNNAATQPFMDTGQPVWLNGSWLPMYGLGVDAWQRYPRFESIAFPLVENGYPYVPASEEIRANSMTATATAPGLAGQGVFVLFTQSLNNLSLFHNNVGPNPTNDYLLGRVSIVPHDVRIEASIYAEEGSFFVIPGPPFNPNPNDRREVFEQAVEDYVTDGATLTIAIQRAQRDRLENFGTFPETPFYGEPLDIKITFNGSISQNMPAPIDRQAQWIRRWGWIPAHTGARYDFNFDPPRPILIPKQHVPPDYDIRPTATTQPGDLFPKPDLYVPNLTYTYDPVLATARADGFDPDSPPVRYDWVDFDQDSVVDDWETRPLPPMPRLPISPSLAYFGEVSP